MLEDICDFIRIVDSRVKFALEEEFQYQMELSDGEWLILYERKFYGKQIEPAITSESQAILQFFAQCTCPISALRLGRSLSSRNSEHGPILSDDMAVTYLLRGMEWICKNAHHRDMKVGMGIYLLDNEFRKACELLAGYIKDMKEHSICPEILMLVVQTITPKAEVKAREFDA